VYGHTGRLRVSTDSFTRFAPDGGLVDRLSREPRWPSGVSEDLMTGAIEHNTQELAQDLAYLWAPLEAAIQPAV
jgi:hypothetical protein